MKLGSVGMSTSHWYAIVALWFAPGAEEGHGTAQRARTYSTALVSKSDSTHGIQGYSRLHELYVIMWARTRDWSLYLYSRGTRVSSLVLLLVSGLSGFDFAKS